MRWLCVLSFSILPVMNVAGQSQPTRQMGLLIPGGPPPDSLGSGTWFGLYRTPFSGHELRLARIRIDSVPDACAGNFKISAAQPLEPLFLIGGLSGLREGPVDTAFYGSTFVQPGDSMVLVLGARRYRLTASGTVTDVPYSKLVSDYELGLAGTNAADSVSQVVVRSEFKLDNTPQVVWVGDIDRDTRPDLFLALPGGGYSRDFVLFLSSLARPPDRVTRAAHYYSTDC
ncbi:MAG: hypothetical protein ACREMA_08580 [Longimicrobiales bacterium]